jgi:hypothetical protein
MDKIGTYRQMTKTLWFAVCAKIHSKRTAKLIDKIECELYGDSKSLNLPMGIVKGDVTKQLVENISLYTFFVGLIITLIGFILFICSLIGKDFLKCLISIWSTGIWYNQIVAGIMFMGLTMVCVGILCFSVYHFVLKLKSKTPWKIWRELVEEATNDVIKAHSNEIQKYYISASVEKTKLKELTSRENDDLDDYDRKWLKEHKHKVI